MKQRPSEIVAEFVLANLPDSLSARKKLLAATVKVLPAGDLRDGVSLSLRLLNEHETQQQQLKMSFAV